MSSEPERPGSVVLDVPRRAQQRMLRMPISTRLAVVIALLTFAILCGFAVVVGSATTSRMRSDFSRQVQSSADSLVSHLSLSIDPITHRPSVNGTPLPAYEQTDRAVVHLLTSDGFPVPGQGDQPPFFGPSPWNMIGLTHVDGYLVDTQEVTTSFGGTFFLQYARPLSSLNATIARVRVLLIVGVLAGTTLALAISLMIARRAMAPIAHLTATAAEIARTRDPSQSLPEPPADDEVAELSRTLQGMLRELDAARSETEATLDRQRRFVADASHELRTPLTSVLANLELLADTLHGEQGEAARSALRSSQRMRRLVADLLLLARHDSGHRTEHREPLDLGQVAVDAASELQILSDDHPISVTADRALLIGAHDELYRVALNLMENAVHHTPAGTQVEVRTATLSPGEVELTVTDDGPGVPEEIAPRLFERFVRGAGDRGGSSGLGLAIVQTVVESHGGRVWHERAGGGANPGARFVVRLPAASERPEAPEEAPLIVDRLSPA
jgi:two-component system, OmpR family, sensor kinase